MNTMKMETAGTRRRLSETCRVAQRLDATPRLAFVEYDHRGLIAFATGALTGHRGLSSRLRRLDLCVLDSPNLVITLAAICRRLRHRASRDLSYTRLRE
jgi:hypothetical protein